MKKAAILGLTALFLLAGCGSKDKDEKKSDKSESSKSTSTLKADSKNQVVCTGSLEEAGMKVTMDMVATIDDDKVSNIGATMSFSDKSAAEQFCSMYKAYVDDADKLIKCDGKTIEFKDYAKALGEEDIKEMKKADFIKAMEKEGLTCK